MVNNRFNHSDAWIFLSLTNIESGTSLENLIAKADWMNHAIPTEDEVEGAINRLAIAGLVNFRRSNIILTDSGKELYEYIYSKKGSMLTLWDKLDKHLNKSGLPFMDPKEFKLKPNELHTAYKKYHEKFWKIYRKMEKEEENKKQP